MPTIYRRETGERLDDINDETLERLTVQGRLSLNGDTDYVFNNPTLPRPRRRVAIRTNNLTDEEELDEQVLLVNHMITNRTTRLFGNIPSVDRGRGLEDQITDRATNNGEATLEDFSAIMDTLSSRPLSFTTTNWNNINYDDYWFSKDKPSIKKTKEDRSKYSKILNTIIDTVELFKKNLDKSLELRFTNGGFLICIRPLGEKTTRVLIKDDDSKTFKVINFKDYKGLFTNLNSIETVNTLCFVKIKSCELSTKVFGYGNVKKTMMDSGENQVITSILPAFKCKKDDVERDIVEISVNGRNIKFCIEDLEFILPDTDLLLKGYTPPKDRTINKGSEVRLVDNRQIGLPKDTKLVVNQINKVGTKRYCTAKYNNKEYTIAINKLKVT
jgi:hypothetical protein